MAKKKWCEAHHSSVHYEVKIDEASIVCQLIYPYKRQTSTETLEILIDLKLITKEGGLRPIKWVVTLHGGKE